MPPPITTARKPSGISTDVFSAAKSDSEMVVVTEGSMLKEAATEQNAL